jgi:hypothetical protein
LALKDGKTKQNTTQQNKTKPKLASHDAAGLFIH